MGKYHNAQHIINLPMCYYSEDSTGKGTECGLDLNPGSAAQLDWAV